MNAQLLQQALHLSPDERIELAEALWDSIAEGNHVPTMSAAQRVELDHRLNDLADHPNDTVSWNEVRAAALSQTGK